MKTKILKELKFGLKLAAIYGVITAGPVGFAKFVEYQNTPVSHQIIRDVKLGEGSYAESEIVLSGHDGHGNKAMCKVKSIDGVVEMDMTTRSYPSSGRYLTPRAEVVTYNSGRTQTTLYVRNGTL